MVHSRAQGTNTVYVYVAPRPPSHLVHPAHWTVPAKRHRGCNSPPPAAYDGQTCELDKDDCASNPCQFGGTCQDRVAPLFGYLPATHPAMPICAASESRPRSSSVIAPRRAALSLPCGAPPTRSILVSVNYFLPVDDAYYFRHPDLPARRHTSAQARLRLPPRLHAPAPAPSSTL
eukprot:gene9556-1717_t